MKNLKILWLCGAVCAGVLGCTNDEAEPEFDILTPEEETQQASGMERDSTLQAVPLPGE